MDIDHMKQHRISKTNNKQEAISFSQSIGARMSAMEHQVPESILNASEEEVSGISAAKALSLAIKQGQKVWTITDANLNLALSKINLSAEAEHDIRNAVNAGKIATAHETRINFNGWIGEGYILIDPSTGAGAYMISGGGNGGEIKSLTNNILLASAAILGFTDGATALPSNVGKPWFSEALKQKWFQNGLSTGAGFLGLFLAIVPVLFDDSLSWANKIGQISLNLLGAGIGGYLTGAAVALVTPAFGLLATILITVMIAVVLSMVVTLLSEMYFSYRRVNLSRLIC